MKNIFSLFLFVILITSATPGKAQYLKSKSSLVCYTAPKLKVISKSYGPILGLTKGQYTFIEIGSEFHRRKISLFDPTILAFGAHIEYNLTHNTIGYKLDFWTKQHRIGITYGASLAMFSNFDYYRYGISPVFGFRLLNFHLQAGANLLAGSKEFKTYNPIYLGLTFYIPSENKLKFKKK